MLLQPLPLPLTLSRTLTLTPNPSHHPHQVHSLNLSRQQIGAEGTAALVRYLVITPSRSARRAPPPWCAPLTLTLTALVRCVRDNPLP